MKNHILFVFLTWFSSGLFAQSVSKDGDPFKDSRDGKTYKTVKIGSQVWMAENLNYDAGHGSYCYDNNSTNCSKYGRLYTWEAAKKVAPAGWHLPSKKEFEQLLDYYGGSELTAYDKLVDNKFDGPSKFKLLYGGWRNSNGYYHGLEGRKEPVAKFWSSTQNKSNSLKWLLMADGYWHVARLATTGQGDMFSVRCVKDYLIKKIPESVDDIDGNTYHWISIGTQVWMIENLNTTKYRDGTAIPNVTDSATWGGITTGAYCNYDNDANNATTYGRLYNSYAVNNGSNIAPVGWHVPSDSEWTILTRYLGESVAGGKLKEAGLAHWASPNTGATNETGFTALPGGYRSENGKFLDSIGDYGYWWTSTVISGTQKRVARHRFMLYYNAPIVYSNRAFRTYGFSVRCVRD